MREFSKIGEELFNKLRGRFPSVTIGDSEGNITSEPIAARYFDFDYKGLGKVSVNLDEDEGLTVIFSKDFAEGTSDVIKKGWHDFLKELRVFGKKRMLDFSVRDITKSNLDKRDYKFLATNRSGDDKMTESKLYGTSRISYQNVGEARIMIKHTESVNQESATGRTQKIGKIYIESPDGERFKYPYKHLSGARAMARHVAEGGNAYDDFGKHIVGLSEEMGKLRKFKNYMGRSAVMAESLSGYMDIVKERISTVKKTIESLQKPAFYKETFEAFETPVFEDVPSDVAENWIDELTIKQFNEELQDIFPYIYNLVKEGTKAKELGPDELVDESGLQYYTGVKKHGKEYMKKAAQAGRDGASQEELGRLKDKYSKAEKKTKEEFELEQAFEDAMGQFSDTVCEECGNQSWTTLGMTEEEIEEGERHGNSKIYDKCWKGYRKVPGKKAGEKGSCKKVESEGDIAEGFVVVDIMKTKDGMKVVPKSKVFDTEEEAIDFQTTGLKGRFKVISVDQARQQLHPDSKLEGNAFAKEGQDVDENTVRELLKRFDQDANEIRAFGDVNPETVIRHLEQGDIEAAVDEVNYRYAGPDGEEPGGNFESLLAELEDDFASVVNSENDDFDYRQEYDDDPMDDMMDSVEKPGDQPAKVGNEVLGQILRIVDSKQAMKVNFMDGKGMIDMYTASAIAKLYDAVNDENRRKMRSMLATSGGTKKLADFAFSKMGESIEESGLQYYIGKKKYGKDGMAKLAQAGREGASEEELGKIKDQYKTKEEMQLEQGFEEMMGQFAEDNFEKNFSKRVGATVKGGKGAKYLSKKADQSKQQNKDLDPGAAKKGLGIGVLDREKVNKKRKEKGLRAKDVRTSPNTRDPKRLPEIDTDEGNAFAHAVRKAKMDGKKKGDKVQGPDGDEITLEKNEKTPLGEFVLSYYDRETGEFPKGETAVLTMVEKDYGEQFIEPAKAFIEQINQTFEEFQMRTQPQQLEAPEDFDRMKELAGLR